MKTYTVNARFRHRRWVKKRTGAQQGGTMSRENATLETKSTGKGTDPHNSWQEWQLDSCRHQECTKEHLGSWVLCGKGRPEREGSFLRVMEWSHAAREELMCGVTRCRRKAFLHPNLHSCMSLQEGFQHCTHSWTEVQEWHIAAAPHQTLWQWTHTASEAELAEQ